MVSTKLNVLNWASRMTPDFACIFAIFACSGKTGWRRGRLPSHVSLLKTVNQRKGLEIFPLNRRTVGRHGHHCSVFAAARHWSFEKTLHERLDALLDAEKTG